jgi:hypothetical protein
MGRPRKEIPQDAFEKLCGLQCTQSEICSFFDVTDKTLNAWCKRTYKKSFSDIYAEKREIGKISLRRAGWKLAQKNPSVHIFYAKNFLGMRDKFEVEAEIEDMTDIEADIYE